MVWYDPAEYLRVLNAFFPSPWKDKEKWEIIVNARQDYVTNLTEK
jgi:hypothetical protein